MNNNQNNNETNTPSMNNNDRPNINTILNDFNSGESQNANTTEENRVNSVHSEIPTATPVAPTTPQVETIPVEQAVTPVNAVPSEIPTATPVAPTTPQVETIPVEQTVTPVNAVPNEVNSNRTQESTAPTSFAASLLNSNEVNNNSTSDGINTHSSLDDTFNTVPKPPIFEEKKKKNKENGGDKKLIMIALIFVLIAAIGFGVYYFLSTVKQTANASIVVNDLKIELGSILSTNVNDYAKITGVNVSNCTVDTSQVDVHKVSTYKYAVTCGNVKKEGTIIVDDATAPILLLNDVTVLPNAEIKAEDFVEQCKDSSSCTVSFAEEYKDITKQVGEYTISILASDAYNNETKAEVKLIVSLNAPVQYLNCVAEEKPIEGINANLVDKYKIGIDKENNFYNAIRISQFIYKDASSYENAVANYSKEAGIYNILGQENFLEDTKTISIKSEKTLEDIEKDMKGSLNKNSSLLSIYMEGYGYVCS